MKNNRGFSLIEMVIVVAIVAILFGGAIVGVSYIQGRGAESCAQKITALMREAEALAMSKYEDSIIIQIDQSGLVTVIQYYKDTTDAQAIQNTTTVGDSSVSLSYETSSNLVTLSAGNSLKINFDRTDGTFGYMDGTSDYCYKIYVDKGGTRKTISLTPKTGKIEIE